jgi:hypothetical protein
MCTRLASVAVCSVLLIACPILIGCTRNDAYRTAVPANCATANCSDAPDTFIEKHDGYDLAYVEFSERGNVFDRTKMQQVLDYVADQARDDPSNPDRGVFTIVFVPTTETSIVFVSYCARLTRYLNRSQLVLREK